MARLEGIVNISQLDDSLSIRLNGIRGHDLCDTDEEVLLQLSYQTNWHQLPVGLVEQWFESRRGLNFTIA